ncbi:MAG: uroporphyrinogen decarboxylase family protein [Pseudomonadota bacterium]
MNDFHNRHSPQPLDRIRDILAGRAVYPVPKGEVWLGTRLLKQAGLSDTALNHLKIARSLGQDLVCLPVSVTGEPAPDLGYRYFEHTDLKGLVCSGSLFVCAVVDGPFQSMVNRKGLMPVLMDWIRKRDDVLAEYRKTQKKTLDLILRCLDHGIHGVMITDDLAGEQSLLISPADIDMLCSPFYTLAASTIHNAGARMFMHSCGKLAMLLPLFVKWKVDGLAAIQNGINNLPDLHQALGPNTLLMAGIDGHLLDSDSPAAEAIKELEHLVTSLAPTGSLILCSSCGLYGSSFEKRIRFLYLAADRAAAMTR